MKIIAWIAIAAFVSSSCIAEAAGKAQHVVILVWDGMRPDFVDEKTTPTLSKLAREGVTFKKHHSVYPSSTEVNGAALATGVYPNRSGIMANREYRPKLNPLKPIDTQDLSALRKNDELSGGRHVAVPTLAEIVQSAGHRTVVAGTKPVVLLQDRAKDRKSAAERDSVTLFAGSTLPAEAQDPIVSALAPFPTEIQLPGTAKNAWTTKSLVEELWKNGVPKLSVLWLSDPDFSQHQTGPGSEISLQALRNSDDNLASVLKALDAQGIRAKTDVLVVSDHGFSTIERSVDVAKRLAEAGFAAVREFKEPAQPGQIMVVGNGGSVLFYVTGHNRDITGKLVEFLQTSDFAGAIFTREAMPGTFTLSQVHIDTPDAPDVVVSMRWSDGSSKTGARGLIVADGGSKPGQGTHATFGRADIHNTLIAAGPDFRRGMVNELPSANIDLAPTILAILGIKPLQPMDGRILREAFAGTEPGPTKPVARRIEATNGTWHQYLQITQLGTSIYFDEAGTDSTSSSVK